MHVVWMQHGRLLTFADYLGIEMSAGLDGQPGRWFAGNASFLKKKTADSQ